MGGGPPPLTKMVKIRLAEPPQTPPIHHQWDTVYYRYYQEKQHILVSKLTMASFCEETAPDVKFSGTKNKHPTKVYILVTACQIRSG